jgi:uncharacterized membrane protein YidH (DUF202 family)
VKKSENPSEISPTHGILHLRSRPLLLKGQRTGDFMKIAGIVLIIAGVIALVYGGFSYTTTKKAVDMGPLQINTKQNHTVPLPPVLGVIAIVGGGALLYFGAKKA